MVANNKCTNLTIKGKLLIRLGSYKTWKQWLNVAKEHFIVKKKVTRNTLKLANKINNLKKQKKIIHHHNKWNHNAS